MYVMTAWVLAAIISEQTLSQIARDLYLCCLWHSWTGYQLALKVLSVVFGDARTASLLFVDNVVLVPWCLNNNVQFAGSWVLNKYWLRNKFGLFFCFALVQVKTNERKTYQNQTKNSLIWLVWVVQHLWFLVTMIRNCYHWTEYDI